MSTKRQSWCTKIHETQRSSTPRPSKNEDLSAGTSFVAKQKNEFKTFYGRRLTVGDAETLQRHLRSTDVNPSSREAKLSQGSSIEQLVQKLTNPLCPDYKMTFQFLLTFRRFCTPRRLLKLLIERYNLRQTVIKLQPVIEFRVCHVIRKWVIDYWDDFASDLELLEDFKNFLDSIRSSTPVFSQQIELCLIQKQAESEKEEPKRTERSRRCSLYLDPLKSLSPTQIAIQLTLIESNFYNQIKSLECFNWVKSKNDKLCPNINALIRHFNEVTGWASNQVLLSINPKKRAKVISKLIGIAQEFFSLKNLNGVLEIVAGLTNGPVHRLEQTWKEVPSKHVAILDKLTDLVQPKSNYRNLRSHVLTMEPPAVPYLGLCLSDLVFIEEGYADYVKDDSLINFGKMAQIANVIEDLLRFQNITYPLKAAPDVINNIIHAIRSSKNCKDLYEISYKREPLIFTPVPSPRPEYPLINIPQNTDQVLRKKTGWFGKTKNFFWPF